MKICVCGKGGSGKSTVVALLAAELRRRGKRVLVVDSDESNAGLYWMLGFEEPPAPLMELAGGRKNIQRTLRAAIVENGDYQETPILARDKFCIDDLPAEHVRWADATLRSSPDASGLRSTSGLGLVCIGKIHQALEGCACPMGVLSREFLKKLQTTDEEVVVVDMEAGVEHFGRGVETSVDAVLVVVEPSLESVSLAERIKGLASGAGASFAGAVLNKIDHDAIGTQLAEELKKRDILALETIPFRQEFVRSSLNGRAPEPAVVAAEITSLAETLLDSDGVSAAD